MISTVDMKKIRVLNRVIKSSKDEPRMENNEKNSPF